MAAESLSSTYTGRVVSVNERGLKLEGHETWMNVSRFAVGVLLPERGSVVTVTTDKSGFLRSVAAVDGSSITPATNGAHGATSAQTSPDRERTIARLAILKAAAEFGASRPDLKSGDVLAIAASWERWVNREPDAPELVDAF